MPLGHHCIVLMPQPLGEAKEPVSTTPGGGGPYQGENHSQLTSVAQRAVKGFYNKNMDGG